MVTNEEIKSLSKKQMISIIQYINFNEFDFNYAYKIVVEDKRMYPD